MCLNRLGVLGHGCLFWARLPLRSIKLPEASQSETAAIKGTVKVQWPSCMVAPDLSDPHRDRASSGALGERRSDAMKLDLNFTV